MERHEKDINEALDASIQERARTDRDLYGGVGLVYWLAASGELVAPWWSKRRDADLRKFVLLSDHFTGALFTIATKLTSVPMHVEPRSMALKSHQKQADEFTRLLVEEADFGQGWMSCFGRWLFDKWAQDNGAFWEIIGPGKADGPLTGPPAGIAHLDSWRCARTSNPEYPVLYERPDGKRFKLHRTRVAFTSELTSPAEEMRGVGFCWTSRAINTTQNLIDIQRYKQEKLGSRPLRAIMLGKGILGGTISTALGMTKHMQDAQGLSRFAKIPIIEQIPVDGDVQLLDLASLPDGFDEETSVTLGMYAIALAGAVPPRWLWPATSTGATKADAMYQHVAGIGGGAGQTLRTASYLLGGSEYGESHLTGKFLPPHLKLVFDFQDDEQDRMASEIESTRAEMYERNLADGAFDIRTVREKMLEAGDITQAQFNRMELQDGRLPDGASALTLFFSDSEHQQFFQFDVENPVAVEQNDASAMRAAIRESMLRAQTAVRDASTQNARQVAEEAAAALNALAGAYEDAGRGDARPYEITSMDDQDDAPELKQVEPFIPTMDVEEVDDELEMFAADLKELVLRAQRGDISRREFERRLAALVAAMAFAVYLAASGKEAGDLTPEDYDEIREYELANLDAIGRLADDIYVSDRFVDDEGEVREAGLSNRIGLWIISAFALANRGRLRSDLDGNWRWDLGGTIEHCVDCSRLNGQVHTGREWLASGWLPQTRRLECGGWNCDCAVRPTRASVRGNF